MKKHLPGWAVLLIITLVAGLALGGTYALTKEPIADQTRMKAESARKAALPDASSFEQIQDLPEGAAVDWVYAGIRDGQTVGYVAQKTVTGFGGKVEVIAGVDTQNAPDIFRVGGITVGGPDFSETAGLGARAKEPAFAEQFSGKIYPISFIKAGGEKTDSTVDALTSATITTTAVVNAVNDIVKFVKADVMGVAGVEMPAKPAEGVFSASEKGFRGPVYVEAAFDGAGKVAYISVGDESFAEDIGAGVKEPDFMYQFIGKQMPLETGDIDMISGATVSSTAVVKALNKAYDASRGASGQPAAAAPVTAEIMRGSGMLQISFTEENGVLTGLNVKEKAAGASAYAACEKEAELQKRFVGQALPLSVQQEDAYAFAVAVAVNKAAAPARSGEEAQPQQPAGSQAQAEILLRRGALQVTITEDGGVLTGLNVKEKAEGASAFAACEKEAELQKRFVGQALPLSVQQEDAYAFAAAVAANKAYLQLHPEAVRPSPAAPAATAAPAPEPTQEPTPEPASAPAVTPIPAESTVDWSKWTQSVPDERTGELQDLGYTGTVTMFFSTVKADVTFAGDVIAELSLYEMPVGGEAFAPLAQEAILVPQLLGQAAPVKAESLQGVPRHIASAAALAVNDAWRIMRSDEMNHPARQPEGDQAAVYTGEAIVFFTAVKADAAFADGKLAALSVYEKPVHTEEWRVSEQNEKLQARFLGAEMPLSAKQDTAYASAVAAAVNQAYARAAEQALPADGDADTPKYVGRCVIFFDQYTVSAVFDGDRLADFEILENPVGDDEMILWESSPLYTALPGRQMPLDPGEFKASYVEQAIVIALNEAYEASLAGQQ